MLGAPDGRVALNSTATRYLSEAGGKAVILLWDKANRKMAMKIAPKGDKSAFAVSLAPDKHSGSLRAKSFLLHIGWNALKRERLPEWNAKERMLEVSIPAQNLNISRDRGPV